MSHRRGLSLMETMVVVAVIAVLIGLLLPAVQKARSAASRTKCQSNLAQVGIAVHGYFEDHGGRFFRPHPFDADVRANADKIAALPVLYWEDELMPYVGGRHEADPAVARSGTFAGSNMVYRCPDDRTELKAYIDPSTGRPNGVEHRTSYLLNAVLSHATRRYGDWTLDRWKDDVGLSTVVAFVERNPAAFGPPPPTIGGRSFPPPGEPEPAAAPPPDPRQDDFRVWLGTGVVHPQVAAEQHVHAANYLYLDGHIAVLRWADAVAGLFPDRQVLTEDGSYP